MHINLPFVFDTTYRNPATGKPSTTTASSSVQAEVPEVSFNDVEPAAQWAEGPFVEKVVGWNGNIYRPANAAADAPVLDRELQNIWPMASGGHANSIDRIFGSPSWVTSAGKILKKALNDEPTPLRLSRGTEILSSTEHRERASAQYLVDGLLMVDRVVWHRVPGMQFVLIPSIDLPSPNFGIVAAPYGHSLTSLLHGDLAGIQNPTLRRLFGLDQMELAAAQGFELRTGLHSIEVLRPDLLAYDGQSAFGARLMNYACRSLIDRVGQMDSGRISAYLSMREAVAAWYGPHNTTISTADIEELWAFQDSETDPKGWIRKGCEIIEVYRSASTTPYGGPKFG